MAAKSPQIHGLWAHIPQNCGFSEVFVLPPSEIHYSALHFGHEEVGRDTNHVSPHGQPCATSQDLGKAAAFSK
ncbi:hypothetical protein EYZ11_007759 [Aspergillus tanneri]|uniref:Uncharacterized protein n=1 Tax=Aspergillus tanneri TaxID=1220188 RepID=A0A4S3JEE4_9EURO|nr:hypothetical protein EYZ11_007759 [Aspergillus tanneri]